MTLCKFSIHDYFHLYKTDEVMFLIKKVLETHDYKKVVNDDWVSYKKECVGYTVSFLYMDFMGTIVLENV